MPTRTNRRTFLKLGAAAASVAAAKLAHAEPTGDRIAVVTDDKSPLVMSEPAQWALSRLRDAIPSSHRRRSDGWDVNRSHRQHSDRLRTIRDPEALA